MTTNNINNDLIFATNIYQILKKNTKILQTTKKTYIRQCLKVRQRLKSEGTTTDVFKSVIATARAVSSYKQNTRNAYITSIVSVLKSENRPAMQRVLKLYTTIMLEGLGNAQKLRKRNIKSTKQTENWVTWHSLTSVSSKIKIKMKQFTKGKQRVKDRQLTYYNLYQDFILTHLYLNTEYMPRLDYHNTTIVYKSSDLDRNINQIFINNKEAIFYLNKFKNVKKFGKKVVRFDKQTSLYLIQWLKYKSEVTTNNTHLFFNKRVGKVYNQPRFSEYIIACFKKHVGKNLNLNTIRSIRSSEIEKMNISQLEKENLHLKLFHSNREGQLYNKL